MDSVVSRSPIPVLMDHREARGGAGTGRVTGFPLSDREFAGGGLSGGWPLSVRAQDDARLRRFGDFGSIIRSGVAVGRTEGYASGADSRRYWVGPGFESDAARGLAGGVGDGGAVRRFADSTYTHGGGDRRNLSLRSSAGAGDGSRGIAAPWHPAQGETCVAVAYSARPARCRAGAGTASVAGVRFSGGGDERGRSAGRWRSGAPSMPSSANAVARWRAGGARRDRTDRHAGGRGRGVPGRSGPCICVAGRLQSPPPCRR